MGKAEGRAVSADSPSVANARRRAEQARAALWATVDDLIEHGHRLQGKLTPGHLAHGAWEAAKSKSVDVAEDAIDVVRKRPLAASGAVAALALFIAREPLMDLAGKLMSSKTKKKTKSAKPKAHKERVEKVDE
jgi:hypothetical protein